MTSNSNSNSNLDSNSISNSTSQLPRPSNSWSNPPTSGSANSASSSNPTASTSSMAQSSSTSNPNSISNSSGSSTPTQRTPHNLISSQPSSSSSSPRRPYTSLSSHGRLPSGSAASFLATPAQTSSSAVGGSLYIPTTASRSSFPSSSRSSAYSGVNSTSQGSASRAATISNSSNNTNSNQSQLYVPTSQSTFGAQSQRTSTPRAAAVNGPFNASSFYSGNTSQNLNANWQPQGNGVLQDSFNSWGSNPNLGQSNFNQASSNFISSNPNVNTGGNSVPEPTQSSPFEENSLISFSWLISDLKLLRDEVELSPLPSEGGRSVSAGAGKSEVWTKQPRFGSGNWMVDLGTHRDDDDQESSEVEEAGTAIVENDQAQTNQVQPTDTSNPNQEIPESKKTIVEKPKRGTTTLSVFLTSVNPNSTSSLTHLMIGLKPAQASPSSGINSDDWVYQHFSTFTFSREHDFFEHHDLPTLTSLLSNERIYSEDSVVLVIQVATGNGFVGEIVNSALSELSKNQLDDSLATQAAPSDLRPVYDPRKITFPFSLPDVKSIPSSMVDSLQGLLDCQLTADVRILVRERGIVKPNQTNAEGAHQVESFPIGQPLPAWFNPEIHGDEEGRPKEVFRHRTFWAHSSILKSRSDYFKTMLDSEFIEAQEEELEEDGTVDSIWLGNSDHLGQEQESLGRSFQHQQRRNENLFAGRKVKTLRISDSDFGTVYWLLKYLYVNEVQFESLEDVKTSGIAEEVEGIRKQEVCWEWKTIEELEIKQRMEEEERQGISLIGAGTNPTEVDSSERESLDQGQGSNSHLHRQQQQHSPHREYGLSNHDRRASNRSLSSRNSLTSIHTSVHSVNRDRENGNNSSADSQPQPLSSSPTVTSPSRSTTFNSQGLNHSQEGRNQSFSNSNFSINQDPHSHPICYSSGAYSLALYKLSHRYGQQDLVEVAKKHLLSSLNPQNAFPTLLATSLYKEIQLGVRGWVYDNWSSVSSTEEFSTCLVEISSGDWGPEAGAMLSKFMRLLKSPTRNFAAAARP